MARLQRIAVRYARVPNGSLIADEIVAEVIEDALTGEVRLPELSASSPEVAFQALDKRLMRVVEQRARRVRAGVGGLLGRRGPSAPPTLALRDVPDDVLAVEPPTDLERLRDALDPSAVVARVRALAQGDALTAPLLASFEDDVIKRRAVLQREPHMTKWHYRTARERLVEYVVCAVREALPPEGQAMLDADSETMTLIVTRLLGLTRRTRP